MGGSGNDIITATSQWLVIMGDDGSAQLSQGYRNISKLLSALDNSSQPLVYNDIIDVTVSDHGIIIGNDGNDNIMVNTKSVKEVATLVVCGDSCSFDLTSVDPFSLASSYQLSDITTVYDPESYLYQPIDYHRWDDEVSVSGAAYAIINGGFGDDTINSVADHNYVCGDLCDILMIRTQCTASITPSPIYTRVTAPMYMSTLSGAYDGNDNIKCDGTSIVFGGIGSDTIHGGHGSDIIVGDW
jgi:Ca2+-binding RTX toxin-like protein